jgi:hypothetical protein
MGWVVSVTPRLLYPREKIPRYQLDRRRRACLDIVEKTHCLLYFKMFYCASNLLAKCHYNFGCHRMEIHILEKTHCSPPAPIYFQQGLAPKIFFSFLDSVHTLSITTPFPLPTLCRVSPLVDSTKFCNKSCTVAPQLYWTMSIARGMPIFNTKDAPGIGSTPVLGEYLSLHWYTCSIVFIFCQ